MNVPGGPGAQIDTLTGEVATQTTVPRKTVAPMARRATRMRGDSSRALIPAKNRVAANRTTART